MGSSDDAIDVRVDVKNAGDRPAAPLSVTGELFGHRQTSRLEEGVPPGQSRSLPLRFPLESPPPGVHALLLTLEYASPSGAGAAAAQAFSQPAYILIALGENPPPAVTLAVPEIRMDSVGRFTVGVSSKDGLPHRASLRVQVPRALRVEPAESSVQVPAQGSVPVEIELFRVDAPWRSQQGLLLVATASDGGLARTTAATGVVQVSAEPGLMPRLRRPLLGLALLLLAAAIAAELRRRREP